MPTITQTPVRAYAHCPDSLCPGNDQAEVDAFRETGKWTYKEVSGPTGLPGVERSWVAVRFAEEADMLCPHCGRHREVSLEKRPVYPVMVSQLGATNTDQRFLLELARKGLVKDPAQGGAPAAGGDSELEALRAQNQALQEKMAELTGVVQGFVAGQQRAQPAAPARRRRAQPEAED